MSNTDSTIQMMTEAQVREPKSTVGLFTLPCGYLDSDGVLHTEVLLREISGKEEDMLASKKVPDQKKMNQLLIACIERLGSISDRERIAAAVPELLVGDRVFLLIAVRRTSLGDDYPYKDQCPSCEKESLMSIDLASIEVAPMPEPTKRIFDARLPSKVATRIWADTGELPPAEKTNPTGPTVRFRPVTGRDEEKFGQVLNKDDALSKSLQARIELLDGKPPTVDDLQALSLTERQYLRDEIFDRADGGVETTLDVTCPKCGHDYTRELEIGQMGFFFPSAARKNSKTRSST
jgi:hypothetical protein